MVGQVFSQGGMMAPGNRSANSALLMRSLAGSWHRLASQMPMAAIPPPSLKFIDRCDDKPGTTGTDRMPKSHGSAIDVHLLRISSEALGGNHRDTGKGF